MRDILMDYVHSTGIRLMLQVCVLTSLAGYAIWAVQILWEG
jgi:succinate dehydrogenase / fumarate reductase membrane anchor subunit